MKLVVIQGKFWHLYHDDKHVVKVEPDVDNPATTDEGLKKSLEEFRLEGHRLLEHDAA